MIESCIEINPHASIHHVFNMVYKYHFASLKKFYIIQRCPMIEFCTSSNSPKYSRIEWHYLLWKLPACFCVKKGPYFFKIGEAKELRRLRFKVQILEAKGFVTYCFVLCTIRRNIMCWLFMLSSPLMLEIYFVSFLSFYVEQGSVLLWCFLATPSCHLRTFLLFPPYRSNN